MNTSKKLLLQARLLRREATKAERIVWKTVRRRQLLDLKFKRQVPLGNYILDFYCEEKKLVIEIDGSQHDEEKDRRYDEVRTQYLVSCGLKVLRVWNSQINRKPNDVYDLLVQLISEL